MAKVAVFCMEVWHCPLCETVLKASRRGTVLASSEYHMFREHNGAEAGWDPPVERTHWAFNVYNPDDETLGARSSSS